MNNTMKKRVAIAKNMLEVNIPIEEIVLMSGLDEEQIKKLKKDVEVRVHDINDIVDFNSIDLK